MFPGGSRMCSRLAPEIALSVRSCRSISQLLASFRQIPSPFSGRLRHASIVRRAIKANFNESCRFNTTVAAPRQHATGAGVNLTPSQRKIIGIWCVGCGAAAAATLTAGGLVRLNKAGLTINSWEVISGILPPMSGASWHEAFERYKQYPEFQYLHAHNTEMTLEEFKRMYWLAYAHRIMGRLVGMLFFVPAAYFWYKGRFSKVMKLQVAAAGSFLASQGLTGWLMVLSGQAERRRDDPNDLPRIDQNLLTTHLATGLLLIMGLIYMGQNFLRPSTVLSHQPVPAAKLTRTLYAVYACACVAYINSLSGSYVAGTDGGLLYGTFPDFSGQWAPKGDLVSNHMPWWQNFFSNPTFCQFRHRILAVITGTTILSTWLLNRKRMVTPAARVLLAGAAVLTTAQIGLGITTLVKNVQTEWASLHQTNNTLLMIVLTLLMHELHWLRRVARK